MAKRKGFDVVGKGVKILKESPESRFNAKQIASLIYQIHPSACEAKRERSARDLDDDELIQQIAREWHSHWRRTFDTDQRLRATGDRPKLFYFSTRSEEAEIEDSNVPIKVGSDKEKNEKISEHDLYPILGEFIAQESNCFSMRIDEGRSSNTQGKRGNHWLFPDVAGMIPLSTKWETEVSDLSNQIGGNRVSLCSYEVKKAVNRSNVREVVFQTISNSSWANYAYLVSVTIEERAMDEMRMLCLAHGIGYIALNIQEPAESQIQVPARFNDTINFDLLNRLASENKDALTFIENVTTFLKTGKDRNRDWNLYPELSD